MRIYLYEHLTASGDPGLPSSLRAEGTAMFEAAVADLAACRDVEVVSCRDVRLEVAATTVDGVLLIAPETDGLLTTRAETVERVGNCLLSPSSEFCRWASDKTQVAATLQAAGVPMPRGILLAPGDPVPEDFPFPAILKPNDGCGSQGISLLPSGEGGRWADEGALPKLDVGMQNDDSRTESPTRGSASLTLALSRREREFRRLEQFVPGRSVSVALMRGAAGVFPLPACSQRLADDGTFAYLGGACPLAPALAARAERLALHAAAVMPPWQGYIGLDLVLGPADDGSQDFLIEVNPRLTTSYVGLRALAETNLAQAMLDVVAGRIPQLVFRQGGIEFDAAGNVRYV